MLCAMCRTLLPMPLDSIPMAPEESCAVSTDCSALRAPSGPPGPPEDGQQPVRIGCPSSGSLLGMLGSASRQAAEQLLRSQASDR